MLQNLMDSWARGEGYSRDQVLEAAQIHMFHEDRRSLRFEITQVQGDTRIKVNPRRGSGRLGDRGEEESRRSRRRRTWPKDEIVSDFEDEPPPRDETPPRQSIEEKLDVPLEELIREPRGDCSASSREPFGNSRRPPQEDRSGSRAAPSAPKIKRPPKPMSHRQGAYEISTCQDATCGNSIRHRFRATCGNSTNHQFRGPQGYGRGLASREDRKGRA